MRLKKYLLIMLTFSGIVYAATFAALWISFAGFASAGRIEVPPWMLIVFMSAAIFPVSYQFYLRSKKTSFTVPVPDPEDPKHTRASRHVLLIFVGLILGALAGKAYFVYAYFSNPAISEAGSPAILVIAGISLFFGVLPWIRVYPWLRRVENDLIEKYRDSP